MKFLAVLAVLAMAFAAFAVIAPAETDDADPTEPSQIITGDVPLNDVAKDKKYVVTGDAKVTIQNDIASDSGEAIFYVLPGVSLTLESATLTNAGADVTIITLREMTSDNKIPDPAVINSAVTLDNPTKFGITYVASTYTGTVCNTDATISGEVSVGNVGVTSSTDGQTAVKGSFKITATAGLDADDFVPGTAYIYSIKSVARATAATTTDTFSDVTYYGADASKTVTIAKDKECLVEAFKGDITVTVAYTNNDGRPIAKAWDGDQTTTFTMTGLTMATGDTGIAIRTYGPTGAEPTEQRTPSVFGKDASATLTVTGAAAVPKEAALDVSKTNVFSTANMTSLKNNAATDWRFIGSTPYWLEQNAIGIDGCITADIYVLGEVTGDVKMNTTTHVVKFETTAKYTGAISAYNGTALVSKIELTSAVVNYEITFSMDADNSIVAVWAGSAATLEAGELDVVNGQLTLDAPASYGFTIGKDATMYVKSGSKLYFADQFASTFDPSTAIVFLVNGTMKVAGTIEGKAGEPSYISVMKDADYTGSFKAKSGAVFTNFIVQGSGSTSTTGNIDLTEAMSIETVSGDTVYSRTYSQLQTVEVSGYYSVKNSAILTIYGTFKVPAGASANIENGAKIVVTGDTSNVDIAGTLNVSDGTFFIVNKAVTTVVSGTLYSEGGVYIDSPSAKISDGGKLLSEGELFVDETNGMAIATGGTLDIRSNFNIAKLNNSGTVIFNEAVLTKYTANLGSWSFAKTDGTTATTSVITMYEKGAEVKFVALGWNSNVTQAGTYVKVTDAGLKLASGYSQLKDNYVQISPATAGKSGVSGLTITENVSSVTSTKKTSGQMILSGNIDYISSASANETQVSVVLGSTAASTATAKTSDILVKDSLRVGEYVAVSVDKADLTVKGEMFFVKYATPMTAASASVTVTGKMTVTGVSAVPDGFDDCLNGTAYKVIGNDYTYVVITNFTDAIADNIDAVDNTNITIYGSVSTTVDIVIPAEIKIKAGLNDPKITIGSGDVINNTVLLENGSEIASGIAIVVKGTLTAENYKNLKTSDIAADVKITNGNSVTYTNIVIAIGNASVGDVITASGDVVISTNTTIPQGVTVVIGDDASLKISKDVTLTVAGVLISEKDITTDGTFGDDVKIVVPGVFMVEKPKTLDAYNIPGAYFDDDDYNYVAPLATAIENAKSITVKGKVTVDDLAIAGTSSSQKTVTIDENSELVADSLDLSYATVVMNGAFTGTILDDYATVYFENVKGLTVTSKTAYDLKGTAVVTDDKGKVSVISGVVTVTAPLALTDSKLMFTVASVADLFVTKSTSTVGQLTVADGVVIGGDVTTINGGSIVDGGKIYLLGNLVVAAADSAAGTTAGSANLKKVFVGIDPETLVPAVGAAASITGASIGGADYVAVAAGSTVDPQIIDGTKSTVFYVDGKEYMTVYALGATPYVNDFDLPYIANAYVFGWGNPVTETIVTTEKVGSIASVYAIIDYSIYTVTIITDNGIKSVAIDGVQLYNKNTNRFETLPGSELKAGTHTVTYTLKNGYEGSAVLYTQDGTILKDLAFVVSGDYETDFVFLLNGTEQIIAPEPSPVEQNEWTITTILLVILVILIAIMAVIVALRLNRS